MSMQGFMGDTVGASVVGRRSNELLIYTDASMDLVPRPAVLGMAFDDEMFDPDVDGEFCVPDDLSGTGLCLEATGGGSADVLDAPAAPESAPLDIEVLVVGEEIASLGVRKVRVIAPGIYALELAQIWIPTSAFGESGWTANSSPPYRPDDGVYLFAVLVTDGQRTESCMATARLEELPLEVLTFPGPERIAA